MFLVLQFGAHGHDNLANVNPSHCALGFSKGTLHTRLEFIGPSPGQKIVDEFPGEDWFSACKQSLIAYSFYLGVGPGENSSQVLLPSQIHVSGNSAL